MRDRFAQPQFRATIPTWMSDHDDENRPCVQCRRLDLVFDEIADDDGDGDDKSKHTTHPHSQIDHTDLISRRKNRQNSSRP